MPVLRVVMLAGLLGAMRTDSIGPINAGRLFLGISYETILSVLALLIAPRNSRRRWSFAVAELITTTAAARLIPGDELLLIQVIAVFVVHAATVLAFDVHANRAEEAGAMATIDHLTGLVNSPERCSASCRRRTVSHRQRPVHVESVGW